MPIKSVYCWHFAQPDGKLGYGPDLKVEEGYIYSCKGRPKLCINGMHGSERLDHARTYVDSKCLSYTKIWGRIQRDSYGKDKLCGEHREVLWFRKDIRPLVVKFILENLREEYVQYKPDIINWRKLYKASEYHRKWEIRGLWYDLWNSGIPSIPKLTDKTILDFEDYLLNNYVKPKLKKKGMES